MFGIFDYIVFVITLLASIGIGLYVRFRHEQKSTEDFLMANRSMGMWPVAFSLMASFMSAITLLGVSNENYQFGIQFIAINISYGIASPIAIYLYLPVFYNLRTTSVYEYLEKRFGKRARLTASLACTLQMTLYMGIVLYAPALAFESVIGVDKNIAVLLIGITVIFYSCLGGMRAVLLTDVFQSILMFVAVFIVIISGVYYAGGIGEIFKVADEGGRLDMWNFDPDPTIRHTWFTLTIGGMFTYLSLYAVNQVQVQRLLSTKSLKDAQKSLWLNWPILSALSFTTSFTGLVLYYYYRKCDPFLAKRITKRDQLLAIYVTDALSHIPGIAGLFVAGIFSASLSSVSSCLNSLAAVTLEDYLKPLYLYVKKRPLSLEASRSAFPTKVIAGVYGIICIGMAFIAQHIGGVLQLSLVVFGAVGGPLLGLFTLGMSLPSANEFGAVTGTFLGLAISLWIGFGQPKPPTPSLEFSTEDCSAFNLDIPANVTARVQPGKDYFYLYRLSYMYPVVIGFLITYFVGWLMSQVNSHFFRKKGVEEEEINPELFFPPIARALRRNNTNNLLPSKPLENGKFRFTTKF